MADVVARSQHVADRAAFAHSLADAMIDTANLRKNLNDLTWELCKPGCKNSRHALAKQSARVQLPGACLVRSLFAEVCVQSMLSAGCARGFAWLAWTLRYAMLCYARLS